MNEAFDFVCMNGVIHHTPNPYESLNVAARCTRKGGHAFVFVFSKNDAPFWPSIELMRKISVPVPMDYAHTTLKSYELPGTKIFNILDYSYTPIQHKLDRKRFEERLRSLFSRVDFLDGGSVHDSAFRCKMFGSDKHIYGISEIRYLLQK
jgi:SAM-dependent methyltransferase